MSGARARIAVCGAGWWAQGWHLPHLSRNSLALGKRYQVPTFASLDELLTSNIGVDGALICTTHATHAELGSKALAAGLHVLMEKPLTTDVDEARALQGLVNVNANGPALMINNSANWRVQTQRAYQALRDKPQGGVGRVEHITCWMHSPLLWLFENPLNTGWVGLSGNMTGNGFGWGQLSHLLAWVFLVAPGLRVRDVFASMTRSPTTGADLTDAAVIRCVHGETITLSGSATVPGNAHAKVGEEAPPVGKAVGINMFGTEGLLSYAGDDQNPKFGRLELTRRDGLHQVLAQEFHVENYDHQGNGPESLQAFVSACRGEPFFNGAPVAVGLEVVRTLDAMYRSAISGKVEPAL